MSTALTRWRDGIIGPMDWAGFFQGLAPAIRVEQFIDHGRYTVRAELPGFDPASDIDLTVTDGVLKITAERQEEKREKAHSEFQYGRFARTVVLPAGVEEKTAVATYTNGVLEIGFKVGEPQPASTHITIAIAHPNGAAKKSPVAEPAHKVNATTK